MDFYYFWSNRVVDNVEYIILFLLFFTLSIWYFILCKYDERDETYNVPQHNHIYKVDDEGGVVDTW